MDEKPRLYISKNELQDLIIKLQHRGILIPYPSKVELVQKQWDEYEKDVKHYKIFLPHEILYIDVRNGEITSVIMEDRLYAEGNALPSAVDGLSNVLDKMNTAIKERLDKVIQKLQDVENAVWGRRK